MFIKLTRRIKTTQTQASELRKKVFFLHDDRRPSQQYYRVLSMLLGFLVTLSLALWKFENWSRHGAYTSLIMTLKIHVAPARALHQFPIRAAGRKKNPKECVILAGRLGLN